MKRFPVKKMLESDSYIQKPEAGPRLFLLLLCGRHAHLRYSRQQQKTSPYNGDNYERIR